MAKRVGPRMQELCQILARQGGTAPSQSQAYLQLDYNGRSSNRFGFAVMTRLFRHKLVRVQDEDVMGNRIPVELTERGWEIGRNSTNCAV